MTAHDPASWTRRLLQVAIILIGAATMVGQVVLADRFIQGTWVGFVGYLLLIAALCCLAAREAKPTLETWARLFGMFAGWIPVFAWKALARSFPDNGEYMLVELGVTFQLVMLMIALIGSIAMSTPEAWRVSAIFIASLSIGYNLLALCTTLAQMMI